MTELSELEISILPQPGYYCTVYPGVDRLTVYFMLSMLFPAHEMMVDRAILEQPAQETLSDNENISGSVEKKVDDYRIDETGAA